MGKNFKKIFFVLALFLVSICVVNAESSEVYYVNNKGIEMTEEQYNFLLKYFDEDSIEAMSKMRFDAMINATDIQTDTIYEVETVATDIFGRVIGTYTKEVATKEEAIQMAEDLNKFQLMDMDTHKTVSKQITLHTTESYDQHGLSIAIDTIWLNHAVPVVKSFDVTAARFTIDGNMILSIKDAVGYQEYNNNYVKYSYMGGNSVSLNNGYGTSMNIVDSATKDLRLSLDILYYYTGSGTATVYATHQHAATDVTLEESQSYELSSKGLGGVLYYRDSSISAKYDGMGGVNTTQELRG